MKSGEQHIAEILIIIGIIIAIALVYWYIICPIQVSKLNTQMEDIQTKMNSMGCYNELTITPEIHARCMELYADFEVLHKKAIEKPCVSG